MTIKCTICGSWRVRYQPVVSGKNTLNGIACDNCRTVQVTLFNWFKDGDNDSGAGCGRLGNAYDVEYEVGDGNKGGNGGKARGNKKGRG